MERAIGEVFRYNRILLQVKDAGRKAFCDGCYFDESEHECFYAHNCIGYCYGAFRSDGKDVVFLEVEDDQIKRISNE